MHYKYTDWDEVIGWCEGYPDKCERPKAIERLVRYSNGKASDALLQSDLDAIEAERAAAHTDIAQKQAEAAARAAERARDYFEFGDNDCILTSSSTSQRLHKCITMRPPAQPTRVGG